MINTSDYITKKVSNRPIITVKSIKDDEGKYQTRELPLNDQGVNPYIEYQMSYMQKIPLF